MTPMSIGRSFSTPILRFRRPLIVLMLAIAAMLNATLLVSVVVAGHVPYDWNAYAEAAHRFGTSSLYDWVGHYSFRYAPLAAALFSVVVPLGAGLWRVLHVVAALGLPSRRLVVAVLVSYPFWFDVDTGNLMVFVLLAAAWAWRGSRIGIAIYMALTILVPRPLMLPLAAWILWRRPEWRIPTIALALVVMVSAAFMGYLGPWASALTRSAGDVTSQLNLGPSRFLGVWWLLIGLPLGAWLTLKGRVGWASLAVSPYLLPYYWLMLGVELVAPGIPRAVHHGASHEASAPRTSVRVTGSGP